MVVVDVFAAPDKGRAPPAATLVARRLPAAFINWREGERRAGGDAAI